MKGEYNNKQLYEIEFPSSTYIITMLVNQEGLKLQFQDKVTAERWQNMFEPNKIQYITEKAGNKKKFGNFIKMLQTAFKGSSEALQLNLMTHHDIEIEHQRKGGVITKATDPRVIKRKYLIVGFTTQFDQNRFPIPLQYNENPSPDSLKLSIHRLSKDYQLLLQQQSPSELLKQISTLKYQNQLLNSRVANLSKQKPSKTTLQLSTLQQQISSLKYQLLSQQQSHTQQLQTKNKKIKELEQQYSKQRKKNEEKQNLYLQKFQKFQNDILELVGNLNHAKEIEKKSNIKIDNLQKQLEKMISNNSSKGSRKYQYQQNNNPNIHYSPARSIKSVDSKGSKQKKNVKKNSSSVYDSDTQSSKMRKANHVSPYRQTSRPSPSNKKKQSSATKIKYNNISNLYSKNSSKYEKRKDNRSRSRSQSKSVKRKESPPSSNIDTSMLMTETENGFASDNEEEKIDTMERLRNYRAQKLADDKNKKKLTSKISGGMKDKKSGSGSSSIQDKISSIASAIRSLKKDNNQ